MNSRIKFIESSPPPPPPVKSNNPLYSLFLFYSLVYSLIHSCMPWVPCWIQHHFHFTPDGQDSAQIFRHSCHAISRRTDDLRYCPSIVRPACATALSSVCPCGRQPERTIYCFDRNTFPLPWPRLFWDDVYVVGCRPHGLKQRHAFSPQDRWANLDRRIDPPFPPKTMPRFAQRPRRTPLLGVVRAHGPGEMELSRHVQRPTGKVKKDSPP